MRGLRLVLFLPMLHLHTLREAAIDEFRIPGGSYPMANVGVRVEARDQAGKGKTHCKGGSSMPDPPPLAGSILDVIGATPLVELTRSVAPLGLRGRLLAKLESVNPGLSKKDRAALELVRCARANGSLRPGQTVVALTSGNMGAGLAVVCRALGHPFVAVMSRGNSVERARQMSALGAEVVLVDQAPGSVPGRVSGVDLGAC